MIDLLDEIEHQKMQYDWTMNELLRSAITDKHERATLLGNAQDPRWTNGALLKRFDERLGKHYHRCIRILRRMHTSLDRLGKILGIENGQKNSSNLFFRLTGRSQSRSSGGLFSPSLTRSVPPQTQVTQKPVLGHTWKPILDLCKTLKVEQTHELGVLKGQNNEAFCLFDPSANSTTLTDTSSLSSLCNILNLNTRDEVEMARNQRFSMAANIACALMQAQRSPWLSRQWTKSEIYFLVIENHPAHIVDAIPYVTQTYAITLATAPSWDEPTLVSADVARTVLFRLGVVIMELVFGRPIESTKYYKHYEVKAALTPEEVEYLAARQWERKVLSEAGEHVQSVIRRCLDCSFEPEPDLKLEDFRAAIYRGVVLPLLNYNKGAWL
ncbi:hypothetical protein E8E11_003681 [Didymella keratinophila]|nr:hypothetical protein E8E11_003681 [Didymella keratinophila]